MGKKGKWLGAVKKVFSPESKEKSDQKTHKSEKKWSFGKSKQPESDSSPLEASEAPVADPPPPISHDEAKQTEGESNRAQSVELTTVEVSEPAEVATEAPAVVIAAIKIQTAFRGYLARRALRALKGLVRLKSLLHSNAVKRQSAATLRCMQTLSKVQSQIRTTRIRMTEENQALQRQLQLKREKELEALRMGEDWDDSLQSKEQLEASLLNKHEAAIRRERALAYAFSRQWKNSSRSVNTLFTDPSNPHWGWSWLERWMAAKSWETRSTAGKSSTTTTPPLKVLLPHSHINLDKPSPTTAQRLNKPLSRQSPSTPLSKASSFAGKIKPPSPGGAHGPAEDDARSQVSIHSERARRHSIAGSSVRDDESLGGSPAIPSYMAATQSARAKLQSQSPLTERLETPEKASLGSAKKRLSFSSRDKKNSSPAIARRHSGPRR
ncbi:unnamed protein product [Spirodela intermedia]|uniref:DUF4005 domain-containing protein n=1 Tax=Spirodela intermedia TaxID=51605 RepID=A0A7I8JIF0_SPIIN|nr:unnamed protein product [Spirodela intermedia]CAA6669323.1 unnamed protein product [Spirodela intermedia]